MSKKGYVATAGGFFVAISSRATVEETNIKQHAVTSNTATESASPLTQPAVAHLIKKTA